jgi:hypothetical protein
MKENLTGSANPFKLGSKYFNRHRRTFVNKNNRTNIKLSSYIYVNTELKSELYDKKNFDVKSTPAYMKNNPLSEDQVKALAKYCKEKNTTLFEFLINRMHFQGVIIPNGTEGIKYSAFTMDYTRTDMNKPLTTANTFYAPQSCFIKGELYMAAGAQNRVREQGYSGGYTTAPVYAVMNAIKAAKVTDSVEKVKVCSNKGIVQDCAMMFFQKF